jgi:hypothetical protein
MRSLSVKPELTNNYDVFGGMNGSTINDYLDASFNVEKSEKMKKRWSKVLENKEKLSYSKQLNKLLLEQRRLKKEKDKMKNFEESTEDIVINSLMKVV